MLHEISFSTLLGAEFRKKKKWFDAMNTFVIMTQTEKQSMEKSMLLFKFMRVQRSGVHIRVGGSLVNRGLGTVLLQITDVSALPTFCCQALKHIRWTRKSHFK